jgi:hypothetical protein
MENIPVNKEEVLTQLTPATIELYGDRVAKLVAEKQMAGLTREQAEQVVTAQLKRDAEVERQEKLRKSTLMPTSPAGGFVPLGRQERPVQPPLTAKEAQEKSDAKEAGIAEAGINANASQVRENNPPPSTPVKVETKETKHAKA